MIKKLIEYLIRRKPSSPSGGNGIGAKSVAKGGALVTAASLLALPVIVMWEGTELTAYKDIVGVWTICSGETQNVYKGQTMTAQQCEELTFKRVSEFAQGIDDMVDVPMSAQYHAALTSWAYNVGLDAAKRSTLIRKLNEGDAARLEAEQNKAGADTAINQAVSTEKHAAKVEQSANAKLSKLAQSRGVEGSTASLRTVWKGELIDRAALDLESLRQHLPESALQQAINSYVRAGGRTLKGAKIYEHSESVIR